jgi:hypothetical protein
MIQRLCTLVALAIACAVGMNCQAASINSWENDPEGWTILQGAYATAGFDAAVGVTDQSYSWTIAGGTAGPNYGAFIEGPATMALTSTLASAGQLSIDVTVPTGGDFGWYLQWSAVVDNADTGYTSLDGYSYSQSANIGSSSPKTLTWSIPPAMRATLAASINPTKIVFQIGGGSNGGTNNTMYLDNLRTVEVPEPNSIALAGFSALIAMTARKRRWVRR